MPDPHRLRALTEGDAPAVAALAETLNRHFGIKAPPFPAEAIRPLLTGARPFLYGVLAEDASGAAIGYALCQDFFDTDAGRMGVWLHDLYVEPGRRNAGLGRALLAAVARRAVEEGRGSVGLAAYRSNPAHRLYERVGAALPEEALVYELRGAALSELAEAAQAL
ncbi:MAG: GNAT family N-acetyltransferase [Alphaproteobacteria bacterium]|nr:GNAT family N-acetyltransferase [Alphaproteobacteria bacterium]